MLLFSLASTESKARRGPRGDACTSDKGRNAAVGRWAPMKTATYFGPDTEGCLAKVTAGECCRHRSEYRLLASPSSKTTKSVKCKLTNCKQEVTVFGGAKKNSSDINQQYYTNSTYYIIITNLAQILRQFKGGSGDSRTALTGNGWRRCEGGMTVAVF